MNSVQQSSLGLMVFCPLAISFVEVKLFLLILGLHLSNLTPLFSCLFVRIWMALSKFPVGSQNDVMTSQ